MAKARQVRKLWVERDVRADVEAARHVVHRDGRDARDEQARDGRLGAGRRRLEFREEVLEEAVAVAQFVVRVQTAFGEDRVREVVVLVDDDVKLQAGVLQPGRDRVQLVASGLRCQNAVSKTVRQQFAIVPHEGVAAEAGVSVEVRLHPCDVFRHRGKVEAEHEVLAALVRRVLPDVRAGKELVEPVGVPHVVVRLEDRREERLAEPAGT